MNSGQIPFQPNFDAGRVQPLMGVWSERATLFAIELNYSCNTTWYAGGNSSSGNNRNFLKRVSGVIAVKRKFSQKPNLKRQKHFHC